MVPAWVERGSLIVDKTTKLLAEVVEVRDATVTIEYDDDGSTQDYSLQRLVSEFRPWTEGDEVLDRTGKGRFANPDHPDYRPPK